MLLTKPSIEYFVSISLKIGAFSLKIGALKSPQTEMIFDACIALAF